MMDNVRRGAELVGGQGGAAPRFAFARPFIGCGGWENGRFHNALKTGQVISQQG